MIRFVGRRAAAAVVTLLVLSAITFLATNVLPADPARAALGQQATPEQLAAFREQQGLDVPVLERYVTWLGNAARGDFGDSGRTRQPVVDSIGDRLTHTLVLVLVASLVAIPMALLLGLYTGRRSGTRADVAISAVTIAVGSLPEFVIGIGLLAVCSVWLGVLPVESSGVVFGDLGEQIKGFVLPVSCLVIVLIPYITRVFRASVRETTNEPFVRSAVLRGLPRRQVTWSHVVPNALAPSVNVIALSVAEAVAGTVVIETVFGFPGIGKEYLDAVLAKDIPVVQLLTMVAGATFVGMGLVADLTQRAIDPRIGGGQPG